MKKSSLKVAISVGLISLGLVGSADAVLMSRLGGQAYYDTVADLTWLADANYAQTSGYDADGLMTWQAANDWAAQLTVGSVSGWRLANSDEACSGFNCTGSELGGLYYNALGNSLVVGGGPPPPLPPGTTTISAAPFSNVQYDNYWSATEYAPNTNSAWLFRMYSGSQANFNKVDSFYGWAVQSGDVSAVPAPEPAVVWLLGAGLLGLIGVSRRKNANI